VAGLMGVAGTFSLWRTGGGPAGADPRCRGGVGHFAVQFPRPTLLRVFATADPKILIS